MALLLMSRFKVSKSKKLLFDRFHQDIMLCIMSEAHLTCACDWGGGRDRNNNN